MEAFSFGPPFKRVSSDIFSQFYSAMAARRMLRFLFAGWDEIGCVEVVFAGDTH